MDRYERKFRRIARQINPLEVQSLYKHSDLEWGDLFADGRPAPAEGLFLGKFSVPGIELLVERFGLDSMVRQRGIRHLTITKDTSDPFRHILRFYDGQIHRPEHLVMEFIARYQSLTPPAEENEFLFPDNLHVLLIDWMILQNPTREFTNRRPRLPGQSYPGLGMGEPIMAVFTLLGRVLGVDGLINVPEHFHTALMFSRRYSFLDARWEAVLQALARDLWQKYRLSVIAWGMELGCITELETGHVFTWEAHKQIMPTRSTIRSYFSGTYQEKVKAEMERHHFRLDEKKLREAFDRMPDPPFSF